MMVLWDMIICAIFGFLIGYYTNALMVTRDRKELKRTFEVMLEKERKTGKWIDHSEDGYVECPVCGHLTTCEGNTEDLHYCFWCGTRMR